jgi:hypothetical protein
MAVPIVSWHRHIYNNQQQICKRVQELIDHSAESQLSIELASECLALAPWNDAPAVTSLDQLRRSREAWQTLRPTRNGTISVRDNMYLTYDVCGHVFAQGKTGQIGVDDDSVTTRMLEFWEMPAGGGLMAVEGEGTRRWQRKDVDIGMEVLDFTFDPSQDALFFVEKQGFVDLLSPPCDTTIYNSLPKIELHFPPADTFQQPAPSRRQNDQDGHGWPTRF